MPRLYDVIRIASVCGCVAAACIVPEVSGRYSAAAELSRSTDAASAIPAAPAASPSPAASAAPESAPSDSCGGPARLLATLNRPTIGYSACAVPKGALVLENGYQNTAQGGNAAGVTVAYPQGFQRFGLADRLELDLIGPAYNRMRAGSSVTTGYSDLGLGFKYELPQRGRFTYALDGLFTAATGTGGFSNGGPSETLNADISYSLSPAIGVGTTLAAASSGGFYQSGRANAANVAADAPMLAGRYGTFEPSLVVTAQIPNYYQFYAEVVGLTKIAPQAGGRVYTDFGVQKLLGSNTELDLEYGIDFTPVSGSRFRYVGTGFGLRVP